MDKLVGIIRARYAAEPVPPCCVCGSAMGIQKAGGGAATVWGCNNFGQDWEHYEKSRWTQNRPGDLDVIEAADRIESQAAEIEALKHDLARSMETANAYLNEHESLTRRVAELEGALEVARRRFVVLSATAILDERPALEVKFDKFVAEIDAVLLASDHQQ